MILTWYGLACVKLETQGRIIAFNPFKKDLAKGLERAPRFKADFALVSSPLAEYNNPEMTEQAEFVIDSPGEYEVQGVFIQGISNQKGQPKGESANTIFLVKSEEISLAHLGALKDSKLTEETLGVLGGVDILLIPVGGQSVLTGAQAAALAAQIEPSLLIPIFYDTPGLKLKLDSVEKFIDELKLEPVKEEKLNVKKKDLTGEETKLVLLAPQI